MDVHNKRNQSALFPFFMIRKKVLLKRKKILLLCLSSVIALNLLIIVRFLPETQLFPNSIELDSTPFTGELWIVVDAVTTPCHDVSVFTKQVTWFTVIVTDTYRKIQGCRFPKCFLLTWEYVRTNTSLFSTTRLLDGPSKISGYLFAIRNGAKVILDADCGSTIENVTNTFGLSASQQSGLWYNGSNTFNPFKQWGLEDYYPIEMKYTANGDKGVKNKTGLFYIADFHTLPLRQGVLKSDSTCVKRDNTIKSTQQQVLYQGSTIVAGTPTFAPISTGPTVFFKESFMFMFLPPAADDESGKIFRTLWINSLRKLSNLPVAYYPVVHLLRRDGHTDACATYKETDGSLSEINDPVSACRLTDACTTADLECYFTMAQQLMHCLIPFFPARANINDMVSLIEAWINDLKTLNAFETHSYEDITGIVFKTHNPFLTGSTLFQNMPSYVSSVVLRSMDSLCALIPTMKDNALRRMARPINEDILLIVVMNYEWVYPVLGYTEFLHRQYFKHIVYCVPSVSSFTDYAEKEGFLHVSSIEGVADGWEFFYQCTALAMKLRLPVRGYLQIGDDVLLSPWNLGDLPNDVMWVNSLRRKVQMYKIQKNFDWTHWNKDTGQKALLDVFIDLKSAAASGSEASPDFSNFAHTFLRNVVDNIGADYALHGNADIFYVPGKLIAEFITAADLFYRRRCMVEIALPVIHVGLTKPEDIFYIPGVSLWDENVHHPGSHFRDSPSAFLHPFKWLSLYDNTEAKAFLCSHFLSLMDERMIH